MVVDNTVQETTGDFVKAKLLQDSRHSKENHEMALFLKKKTTKQAERRNKSKRAIVIKTQISQNLMNRDFSCQWQQRLFTKIAHWLRGNHTHITYQNEDLTEIHDKAESQIVVANNQKILSVDIGETQAYKESVLDTISEILYVTRLRTSFFRWAEWWIKNKQLSLINTQYPILISLIVRVRS